MRPNERPLVAPAEPLIAARRSHPGSAFHLIGPIAPDRLLIIGLGFVFSAFAGGTLLPVGKCSLGLLVACIHAWFIHIKVLIDMRASVSEGARLARW